MIYLNIQSLVHALGIFLYTYIVLLVNTCFNILFLNEVQIYELKF